MDYFDNIGILLFIVTPVHILKSLSTGNAQQRQLSSKYNFGYLCSTDCVSVFLQTNTACLKGGCTHCVQQSVLTERVPTMYKTLNCILN